MKYPEESSFAVKDCHRKPFYFLGIADFEPMSEILFNKIYGEKQ